MADGDRRRWDDRHAATEPGAPREPEALADLPGLVPTGGRALDVACGQGATAVWLALRGSTVDAVDVSAVGLAATAASARRHGVAERVTTHRHDLDAGLPSDCRGPYDVVVCLRFRAPALYPVLADVLDPGGLLVVTVLSEVGLSEVGAAPGPFRAAPGELRVAFADLDVRAHREADGVAHLVALKAPAVRPGSPGSPPVPPAPS